MKTGNNWSSRSGAAPTALRSAAHNQSWTFLEAGVIGLILVWTMQGIYFIQILHKEYDQTSNFKTISCSKMNGLIFIVLNVLKRKQYIICRRYVFTPWPTTAVHNIFRCAWSKTKRRAYQLLSDEETLLYIYIVWQTTWQKDTSTSSLKD